MDPLMIGFGMMQNGLYYKKLRFKSLSEKARQLIRYRKLWDSMDKIPMSQNPIARTRKLLEELRDKVR